MINSSFFNNFGKSGVIAEISNNKNNEILFDRCVFDNNTSQNSLFDLENMVLAMKNLLFQSNQGRIMEGSDFSLNLKFVNISNHACFLNGFQGCVFFVDDSSLNVSNFCISHLVSNFTNDLFYLTNSEIFIDNIQIENVETLSSTLLLYGKNSFFEFSK